METVQAHKLWNRINALCNEKHIKYGMLAVIMERTPATVTERKNHPETFRVDELIRIAKYFRITLKELVGGEA